MRIKFKENPQGDDLQRAQDLKRGQDIKKRRPQREFLKKVLADRGQHLFVKEGFACMVGILLRLAKENAICGEVPIILRYDRKSGFSKMKVGITIWRTLVVLVRERFAFKKTD